MQQDAEADEARALAADEEVADLKKQLKDKKAEQGALTDGSRKRRCCTAACSQIYVLLLRNIPQLDICLPNETLSSPLVGLYQLLLHGLIKLSYPKIGVAVAVQHPASCIIWFVQHAHRSHDCCQPRATLAEQQSTSITADAHYKVQ